jgi:hypothetical protein
MDKFCYTCDLTSTQREQLESLLYGIKIAVEECLANETTILATTWEIRSHTDNLFEFIKDL